MNKYTIRDTIGDTDKLVRIRIIHSRTECR